MLTAIGSWAERRARTGDPWTNVYGIARSVLALATATTLLANPVAILFHPAIGLPTPPLCDGARAASVFCVSGAAHVDAARVIAGLLLLVVASGYRPRFTGILHLWLTWSLSASAVLVDGGDQVATTLSMLLVPVTLLDGRRWHWSAPLSRSVTTGEVARRVVAFTAFTLIRVQVAGIYFHAAVAKFHSEEWADGTALYYWGGHPIFGAPTWLTPLIRPLLANGVTVSLLTWGVIVLELFLCMALVMPTRGRKAVLVGGIALHIGIIFLHGLVSFGSTMVAALVLFLWPVHEAIAPPDMLRRIFAMRWRANGKRASAAEASRGMPSR